MERTQALRVGVLTGGGDCPGLNAVIRAIVKTAHLKYRWTVLGIQDGFDGLLQYGKVEELSREDVKGILYRGGTILGTTNRSNPFEYKFKKGDTIIEEDRSDIVMMNYKGLNLDALIVIGGDGSLKIANRFFEEKGMPVVGIPKTIDNDLEATDMTFGYQTAIQTATEAIDKLHTTAESHHRVMVVETMGRYVGWIAVESGIAGGADVILIPEIPFELEKVREAILARRERGRQFSIVVIAEGAKPQGGDISLLSTADKELGAERLGGIADVVARQIAENTDLETRVTVLGHIQRGGVPTAFDRILSTRFGAAAVNLVAEGQFGEMVCLETPYIRHVPIKNAVARFKAVDPDGQLVTMAERTGVSFGR